MKETRFKQTEIGLVPEEWRVVRLGEVCKTSSGGTPSRSTTNYYRGNIPWVTTSELKDDWIFDSKEHISEDAVSQSSAKVFESGTLLMAMYGATIGRLGILKIDAATNQACCAISSSKASLLYLFYHLLYKRKEIVALGCGAGQPNISQDIVKYIEFPFPPLAEQSRIAGALSSVDGLLSSLARLIEKKRALRTATMQRLLTAKTRLPGFNEPWKEVRLGDYFDIGNGYTPSKANPAYWTNGTIPWFRMEDIRTNGRILSDSIQHITPQAVKGGGLFPKNSIILSTTATIGEHALLIADSLANQRFSFLVRKLNRAEEIDIMYFFYQCFALGDWCRENINEGGLAAVNMEDLKNYLIPLPSLPEQRAIAAVLSSMDSELSALEAKRAKVEALRTGMMHELLTGRIRLTECE